MIRYSHLLKNFPQFVVFQRVKGFGVVNKENRMKEMIELRTEINEYGPISLTTLETKMLNAQPNQAVCVCVCVCGV